MFRRVISPRALTQVTKRIYHSIVRYLHFYCQDFYSKGREAGNKTRNNNSTFVTKVEVNQSKGLGIFMLGSKKHKDF